ncbi:Hypothetical protein PHPALM_8713 [Phytophthora palmivora]|uniref:Uncharacterized protein n=1 Tax=Phytophthora palmivora TaxID=4796 RepID=A0A2P4Y958_9STRA|nr:Hypothetical protein PHPALM_8713 [Phytophthora palmivora]
MEHKGYNFYCKRKVEETHISYRSNESYLQAARLPNLSNSFGMIWKRVMASMREAYPNATLSTIGRTPGISVSKYTTAQVTWSDTLRSIEVAIVIQTGNLLEPSSLTCDFVHALMDAVTEQFFLVGIVECLLQ